MMFIITSMPVGGAETLLVELVRRLQRSRFSPDSAASRTSDPWAKCWPRRYRRLPVSCDTNMTSASWGGCGGCWAIAEIDAVVTVARATRCSGAGWPPGGRSAGDLLGPALHRPARPR